MEAYSSSSDDENSEDALRDLDSEDQEMSGLFLKRRKRHHMKNTKEKTMLGVFADESDDDDSVLSRKNLRYKHVHFISSERVSDEQKSGWRYTTQESAERLYDSSDNSKEAFLNYANASRNALNESSMFDRVKQNTVSGLTEISTPYSTPVSSVSSKSRGTSKSATSKTPQYFKSSGFGARMMEKMGYVAGQGLGSQGQGILNPVETKVRPARAGLGLIKEKTQQAIEESRRRGEEMSENEEQPLKKSFSEYKSEKQHKEKVKYKTASEIAGGMEVPLVLQQIIDMTGKDVKLIENVSGTMSIPMVLSDNDKVYQISQMARRDLEMHATEWKQLQDRKAYIKMEETRINEEANQKLIRIQKLEKIIEEMEQIHQFCKNDSKNSLEILNDISEMLEKINFNLSEEIETYCLDEVIISIIFPIIKLAFSSWDPLEEPTPVLNFLYKWKQILGTRNMSESLVDDSFSLKQTVMTPFESMLQHLLIPKIRSAINNTWDPHNPSSALLFYESWKNLLSPFIQDFILNQLILPKLQRSVSDWNPRKYAKKKDHRLLHIWVFPWLPLLKENTETLIDTVKRKFKMILSSWDIRDGSIEELNKWKEILGDNQFEKLMLDHLLPKLSACLRFDFYVDPSDQKLEPLEWVLPWRNFFRPSVFDQLFVSEFFPKWMEILYLWLTDSECNYAQVSEWYQWWQQVFPSEMLEMPMIRDCFVKGLDMMHQALNFGKDVAEKLSPPILDFAFSIETKTKDTIIKKYEKQLDYDEVEFKDVVEEFCLENDLILIPLRKAHEDTGNPLFRITASASGSGGIIVYIKGDVVWVQNSKNKNEFSPESLNHILTLAQRSNSRI